MRTYNMMIIFESTMSEEGLEKALGRISDEVAKFGGKTQESKMIGKRAFARPMKKKHDGLYVKLSMEFEPLKIDELKERFRLNEDIFRVQILVADEKKVETA